MTRKVRHVSWLDPEDKAWLDAEAKRLQRSPSEYGAMLIHSARGGMSPALRDPDVSRETDPLKLVLPDDSPEVRQGAEEISQRTAALDPRFEQRPHRHRYTEQVAGSERIWMGDTTADYRCDCGETKRQKVT